MRKHTVHLAIFISFITLSGCGSGDSASSTTPTSGENKSMSPSEVQKELEKFSPPATTGKVSTKKK